MWEIREQIKRLMDSTYMGPTEVAETLSEQGLKCYGSEVSRAMYDTPPTRKQHEILMSAHRLLVERQEQMNAEKEKAIAHAQRALAKAESMNSTAR